MPLKNKIDFEREYRKATFPYKEIISSKKDLRNSLFAEFLTTKQKPCFDLYLYEHYTEKQLNEGFAEAHKQTPSYVSNGKKEIIAASFVQSTPFESRVNELYSEYINKVGKNTLETKYHCFDLEATNTVKTLNEIGKLIEKLKKVLLTHDVIDYDTETRNFATTILALMERLEYQELRDGVFSEILNDKENFFIHLEHYLNTNKESNLNDKYSRLKMYFDNYLKEGYRSSQKNDAESEVSHREIIIAHSFKVKAGIKTDKTASQWKNERGEKARQQYYTTLKQSENYKEPTRQELSKVIELLKDFPTAQKMAINKHAELESL